MYMRTVSGRLLARRAGAQGGRLVEKWVKDSSDAGNLHRPKSRPPRLRDVLTKIRLMASDREPGAFAQSEWREAD
ncbi:hypothetical protein TNCT_450341 [Trichonephila clavata]|uniref:Uncharacterized protein n=1 Tax=Trichonephila clavata TaxID=2740835 RepID=A0A8X6FV75_TRICU|nr:hypothetical protein TNCT_450341 [Trichonephila clavata]